MLVPRRAFIFVGTVGLLALALCDCGRSGSPKFTLNKITGTSAQRVTRVTAIIGKHHAPPTALLDAQFLEEQTGDGNLGPSDFQTFYRLDVAPADILAWTRLLTPLGTKVEFAAPRGSCGWWISSEAFGALKFYEPALLTGRSHGWIGLSLETGRIYIFTFTM